MRNDAIIIEQPNTIVQRDIGVRDLGLGCARVAVKAVGICGSDISYFKGTAQTKIPYPLVIGHEVSGEIVEVRGGDVGLVVGDHVVVSPYTSCGRCYPCSVGRSGCCTEMRVLGTHLDGCAMEWCDLPVERLVKAPRDLPWTKAAMAEPFAIALHGMSRSRLAAGEHVVIIGAGAIGCLTALAALSVGAVPIMLDIADAKLEFAKSFGAQFAINTRTTDARERIREITGGRMAEVVMEISGANAAVASSFDYVAHAGRLVLTGWAKSPLEIDTRVITRKEIDVLGQRNTDRAEIGRALHMIHDDTVDVMKLVTRTIPFEGADRFVEHMAGHPEENVKVIAVL
jgi:2-desacetyl-2-hydroxyethyl bacteriochlorophyllide A dehydrogenase